LYSILADYRRRLLEERRVIATWHSLPVLAVIMISTKSSLLVQAFSLDKTCSWRYVMFGVRRFQQV